MSETTTGIIDVSDARIEYFSVGAGNSIVLLPGAGSSVGYLERLAGVLADNGYRAIRVNPRGAGKSTGGAEGVTMHTLGDDVAGVIQALDLGRVDIAGHAFGNRVARTVANDHAEMVGSVILFAAGGEVAPEPEVAAAVQKVLSPDITEAEFLDAMGYWVGDPADVAPVWEVFKPGRSPEAAAPQASAMKSTPAEEWAGGPGDSQWLIVQGSRDQVAPPRNGELLKERYGDRVRLVSIEGAGHAMVFTRAEETTEAIVAFLRDRDGSLR